MSLLVSSGGGGGPITASDITDSSASGRTVLTGTAAQGLGAIGPTPQYTAAQLAALTDGNRPPVAYCTDCLVPEGVGASVFWTGTAWVCTCSMFPVVTTWIDYYRAEFARGGTLYNKAGQSVCESVELSGTGSLLATFAANSGGNETFNTDAPIYAWRRAYGALGPVDLDDTEEQ